MALTDAMNVIQSAVGQNNSWSAQQAQNQMAFQAAMSNTAHQREVADLQAAGLNPILSAHTNGASTPTGAMGQTDQSFANAVVQLLKEFGTDLVGSAVGSAVDAAKSLHSTPLNDPSWWSGNDPDSPLSARNAGVLLGSIGSKDAKAIKDLTKKNNTGLEGFAYNRPSGIEYFTDLLLKAVPQPYKKDIKEVLTTPISDYTVGKHFEDKNGHSHLVVKY